MSWEGVNRRKFPRANYPCLVIIRRDGMLPQAMLTHTENIGIGGVCVILKKDLGLFTPVEIELDLMDTKPHIKSRGKVVWVVRRKDTEEKKPLFFDTGIEFVNLNDADQKRINYIVDRLSRLQQENA